MNNHQPIVYIVDDDPVVGQQLSASLKGSGYQISLHLDGPDFLKVVEPSHVACVLLDMRMPEMSGLEVQEALREKGCVQPVIFTTAFEDLESAVTAMRHGAMDYLLKPVGDRELLDRVKSAIEEAQASVVQSVESERVIKRYERLTPREREVLALMIEGKANKIMSIDLGVSQRTVEIHRARVMEKMEANSLADLFRLSLYLNLIN